MRQTRNSGERAGKENVEYTTYGTVVRLNRQDVQEHLFWGIWVKGNCARSFALIHAIHLPATTPAIEVKPATISYNNVTP